MQDKFEDANPINRRLKHRKRTEEEHPHTLMCDTQNNLKQSGRMEQGVVY